MKTTTFSFLLLLTMFFYACDDDDKDYSPPVIDDNFDVSLHNWIVDFADYPTVEGDSMLYQLKHEHAFLPEPLDKEKKALLISGINHSDDLFMFLKKKISGFKPDVTYEATFDIEFASDAPSNAMGVGGSPGESVYVGVGLTKDEPVKVDNQEGYYRMNIKKIEQSQDGEDMKVIGNVANGTDESVYKLVKRNGTFKAKAGSNGELWAIVGTESGFEALTTLYYTNIKITFTEVN